MAVAAKTRDSTSKIYNPSDDVKEVLELTKVGEVIAVREVEL